METIKSNTKKWSYLSILCVILGIAIWIPNLVFNQSSGYWVLTFIINPIGIIFGFLGRNKLAVALNMIMTLSFPILTFVGYLVVALQKGHP
jgi:hypothetical protein